MKRSTSASFAPGVSVCGMISSLSTPTVRSWCGSRTFAFQAAGGLRRGGDGRRGRAAPAGARTRRACSTQVADAAAPIPPDASRRSAVRRSMPVGRIVGVHQRSPRLICSAEIVGGAPRQREDGQRRVLLGGVRERRAVDDEDVLDLVHLVEAVQRRALRIRPHPAGAVLVDRRAVAIQVAALVADQLAAGRLDDLLDGVVHVLGHLPLVLADAVVDRRQRHAVAVLAIRIDGDAVVRVRQHFAVWMDLEPGRVPPLDLAS